MDARRRVEQIIDEYWDSHPDMLFNALDREGLIEQGIPRPRAMIMSLSRCGSRKTGLRFARL